MSVTRHRVHRGRYYDSVVLMQLQRGLADMPEVEEAGVVMATPANKELMKASGLLDAPPSDARPDDLLIAVRATTGKAADEALAQFETLLAARRTQTAADYRPKSLAAGLRQQPDGRWVLVSVPGRHAASVARRALEAERNVFLYSDNVSLDDEVALKRLARDRRLLVLGPDCGTSIVGGVGLGFANRVRRGPVGLIAASGTGLQTIASRLHALGSGVSQGIGTGGRDLSAQVGGETARAALEHLGADPDTRVVVIVSKPPDPTVARRLLGRARAIGKPVVVQFQGYAPPARRLGDLTFAADLEDAARLAVGLVERPASTAGRGEGAAAGVVRGLFSGGTLAGEAWLRLSAVLPDVATNLGGHQAAKLAAAQEVDGHGVIDLGADELTVGRPHPMIDPSLVAEQLERAVSDPAVGVLLLDVVLGDGAHPDPAAVLAPAIERAVRRRDTPPAVEVVLVGTDEDPQEMAEQRSWLTAAGARVHATLGGAVDAALERLEAAGERFPAPRADAFASPLEAVNVGVEIFYQGLLSQGAKAVQVDWRPPAGGNERLASILARLERAEEST